jgi:hypothetical protein
MNPEFVQNLRYKLQRRVRRVHSTRAGLFHYAVIHLWKFLSKSLIFSSLNEELRARIPDAKETAQKITQGVQLFGENEIEQAAISSWVVEDCAKALDTYVESKIGIVLHRTRELSDQVEVFYEQIIEPLYDHLDEQIDDKGAILSLITRYQHRAEWFHRERLHRAWDDDTVRGEKALALDLYEYLYEQGIEFYIEPSSVSGEIDLIAAQTGPEPLLADVKIFCPDRSKGEAYLARGFHQLYTYCRDYNQSCGYLVIFNVSPDDLRISTKNQSQSVSYVTHNNKTIFFVVVDLFLHSEPASKRGVMKCRELKEEDLFRDSPSE